MYISVDKVYAFNEQSARWMMDGSNNLAITSTCQSPLGKSIGDIWMHVNFDTSGMYMLCKNWDDKYETEQANTYVQLSTA